MVPMHMPRYVSHRKGKDGVVTFYWTAPTADRKQGCPYRAVTLGKDLTQKELNEAAGIWNERLLGWRSERGLSLLPDLSRFGTVEWLVNAYLRHDSFLERVGEYSRPDYHRILQRVCDLEIMRSDGLKARIGDAKVVHVGVTTAEKVYHAFHEAGAARTAEKVVTYCKAMWGRMRPHHPDLFRPDTPNPWEGVTLKRRKKAVKGHVGRDTVYAFAEGAIENGRPELAAAAVLAFEFLMRPSSIGAGYAAWSGYRGASAPDKIIVNHRKNGERAEHPLEYRDETTGEIVRTYPQAESILARVPRNGLSIVCQRNEKLFGNGTRLSQEITALANRLAEAGLPVEGFTLDKARHGGMTELEEQGLTEGQGRALSKHRTGTAYRGYAKETEKRVLEATKKRMGISESPKKPNKINGRKSAPSA